MYSPSYVEHVTLELPVSASVVLITGMSQHTFTFTPEKWGCDALHCLVFDYCLSNTVIHCLEATLGLCSSVLMSGSVCERLCSQPNPDLYVCLRTEPETLLSKGYETNKLYLQPCFYFFFFLCVTALTVLETVLELTL